MKPIPEHMLQPCDIILVAGTSRLSRGIMLMTGSPWSHAILYVGGGRQRVIEAINGASVEANSLETALQDCSRACVRRYPGLTVEDAEIIKGKAYSMVGMDYDEEQNFGLAIYNLLRKIGIKAPWLVANDKAKFNCSETVNIAYRAAMIVLAEAPEMETPASLGETSKLVTVWDSLVD